MKTSGNPSYKVVIVGESGVGKTTLMLSYIQDLIILDAKPTVGKLALIQEYSLLPRTWFSLTGSR